MAERSSRRYRAPVGRDRKSTRLNSSHRCISYAVFCLKKKKNNKTKEQSSISKKRQCMHFTHTLMILLQYFTLLCCLLVSHPVLLCQSCVDIYSCSSSA